MYEKYNYEKEVIVLHSYRVYDFVYEGESDAEAIERARQHYDECFKRAAYKINHPKRFPAAFWESTANDYKAILDDGFQVMSPKEFLVFQRQHLITGEPEEISKETYEAAFDGFPPILLWETIQGVEMFCSMEAYVGTYRWQYAHDHVTGKYYTKLVDGADKTTWINEYLRK